MGTIKLIMNRERARRLMESLELGGEQKIWTRVLKQLDTDADEIRLSISDDDLKDWRVAHSIRYNTLIRSDKFDTQNTISIQDFSSSDFYYK
jgi:hypothetical protein